MQRPRPMHGDRRCIDPLQVSMSCCSENKVCYSTSCVTIDCLVFNFLLAISAPEVTQLDILRRPNGFFWRGLAGCGPLQNKTDLCVQSSPVAGAGLSATNTLH